MCLTPVHCTSIMTPNTGINNKPLAASLSPGPKETSARKGVLSIVFRVFLFFSHAHAHAHTEGSNSTNTHIQVEGGIVNAAFPQLLFHAAAQSSAIYFYADFKVVQKKSLMKKATIDPYGSMRRPKWSSASTIVLGWPGQGFGFWFVTSTSSNVITATRYVASTANSWPKYALCSRVDSFQRIWNAPNCITFLWHLKKVHKNVWDN